MSLLVLPTEILIQILSFLHPKDVLRMGVTCRQIRHTVKPSNNILWQNAFLQVFDDPRHRWMPTVVSGSSVVSSEEREAKYWYTRLKRRLTSLASINTHARGPFQAYGVSAEEATDALLDILDTAKTGPTDKEIVQGIAPQVDDRRSLNLELLSLTNDQWIRLESLIHDCHMQTEELIDPSKPTTRSMSQARMKGLRSKAAHRLHVLYGRTQREKIGPDMNGPPRRIVYDWNNPVAINEYGPFEKNDPGKVDWRVLEAVMSVMLRHFEMGAEGRIAIPPGFCYSIPCRTLVDPTTPEDWAKVTGSWVGTYSFLDYPDLFAYNTQAQAWDMEEASETHGDLMVMQLKLDMSLKSDPKYSTNMPISNKLPTLYFSGSSKSFDPYMQPRMHISVKGSVSLCASNREVRWRYLISYRGEEQWRLEGVQPGGVRAGPVYGLWTQWSHDEHAPVGAFMYVPEELCKKQQLVFVT